MKTTTIWDFAIEHPIIFTLIASGLTTAAVRIVYMLTTEKEQDKNGN